jgi:hypothetical protein
VVQVEETLQVLQITTHNLVERQATQVVVQAVEYLAEMVQMVFQVVVG